MDSTFFPPATESNPHAENALDYDTEEEQEEEQRTEATTEMLSQLPDAPINEPVDIDHAQQPSQKKQKTEEGSDDDFVVVDNEETDETKPKGGL